MMLFSSEPFYPPVEPYCQFQFPSTAEIKQCVLEEIMDILTEYIPKTDDDLLWTRLVIDEALVNAVEHGNGSDPDKDVLVSVYIMDGRWRLVITDEGEGFSEDDIPSPEEESSLFMDHGRGIHLMRNYLDVLQYYSDGRTAVLDKSIS